MPQVLDLLCGGGGACCVLSRMLSLTDVAAFSWVLPLGVFLFGGCVGSFLNVVIVRNPRGESVLRPGSRCAACGTAILWRDNIPVLGWLLRRGQARCCGARFSFRYCAVELLTALLFLGCWLSFPPLKAACGMLFLALLIVASVIDFDHRIIPDWLTIGGAVLGLFLSLCVPELHGVGDVFRDRESTSLGVVPLTHFHGLASSAQGLFIGSGLLLWIALVAEVFLKKEAMGFGDVKFVGMIGAFCGWEGAIFAIFGGAIIGTLAVGLIGLAKRLFGRNAVPTRTAQNESSEVAFGPMLAAAAAIYFWGKPLAASLAWIG